MTDDDALDDPMSRLRDHVRAEQADDAALEAVARGEAGTELVAELERRAAGDAQVAAMVQASRPLGAEAEARIAATLVASANAKASANANAKANGRVLAFVRRNAMYVAPFAVAAAALVYVGRSGSGAGGPALPDYTVVAISEREMRGAAEPQAALELRGGADAGFEIVARPATTAATRVVAYVFAVGEGEPSPVDATIEIAPGGAVKIKGRARALAGAREVRVVLGAPTDFTRYEDALSRARDGKSDAHVRVLSVPIVRLAK
jgi:hypothetical protein